MINSKINYDNENLNKYLNDLSIVGSLSGLFGDDEVPNLYYRVPENLYCASFGAQNLSRADIAVDAKLGSYGIGIKTFKEENSKTFQKIAEFDKEKALYEKLTPEDKVRKIAELRNERLYFAKNTYNIDKMIYHCVVRNKKGFYLFEEDMIPIDIKNLIYESKNKGEGVLNFHDQFFEYKFYESKSTLLKRFITKDYFANVDAQILENPINLLSQIKIFGEPHKAKEELVLPLYSTKNHGITKFVPVKSGLNQWNANGRRRDPNEVYIAYPAKFRTKFNSYFPDRNTPFDVHLPNGKIISMKVCQDDGKALMSNPNKTLGEWILRDVLKLPEKTIVTYKMLLEIGVDCIVFEKSQKNYWLSFGKVGRFEEFSEKVFSNDEL